MAKILSYEEKDTWIHELSGVTKLIFFLLWCLTSMLTYDTRVLAAMLILALIIFKISQTEWKQVGAVFKLVMVFLVFNVLAIYLFSPDQGTAVYGTKTVLFHIAGRYDVTIEQLFYELNVVIKYFTVIPAVFMFLVTTNPSEFAASLNKMGATMWAIPFPLPFGIFPMCRGSLPRSSMPRRPEGSRCQARLP